MNLGTVFVAALLLLPCGSSFAAPHDRLQVGIHEPETPLRSGSGEPVVVSTRWSEGDLQVLLTQAAPCGNVIPVDPVWEKAGATIVLRYRWLQMPVDSRPSDDLCLKHVQAWVFNVPDAPYTVLISDAVPRFGRTRAAAAAK